MLAAVNSNTPQIGDHILGLIEYYETIFEDNSLVTNESEFKSIKLNLILDLIDTVRIPDDLMMELRSAIISAWRLNHSRGTRKQRSGEMDMILCRLENIRRSIELMVRRHQDSISGCQLDIAVLHALPLRRLDMEPEDVDKVGNLLSKAIEYLNASS